MSNLTNRERFLSGHKFMYSGNSRDIFEPYKSYKASPVTSIFHANSCILVGHVLKMTKDTIFMHAYIFGKLVNFRISFTKMTFLESEVTP